MVILNSVLMSAVMEIRAQGNRAGFPCTVLADGSAVQALLGPYVPGSTKRVYVLFGSQRREVEIGTVSLEGETLATIETTAAQMYTVKTRPAGKRLSEITDEEREARQQEIDRYNARYMWKRTGWRRNPITGRNAGHHCEKAGR